MKQYLIFALLLSFSLVSCNKNKSSASVIKPQFISDQDFSTSVLDKEGLVVVDFWATWCGPCRDMDPVIQDLANHHRDVTFVKIDVDKNKQVKEQYSVWGLPTIVFFKDGKEVSRQVGLTTEGTVNNKINRFK